MRILGDILSFDWLDPTKVSVVWTLSGSGNYSLPTVGGYKDYPWPCNAAVDVYMNEWVQVYLLSVWKLPDVQRQETTAHQNQYFRTIRVTSQWRMGAASYCEIFKMPDPFEFDMSRLLSVRSLLSFKIEHKIDSGDVYFAPDNWYSFSAVVFVIDRATNKSVPITSFGATGLGTSAFTTEAEVKSSRNVFIYEAGGVPITVVVESNSISVGIRSTVSARALTYSMFAINWVLTVCSLITTLVASHQQGEIGVALLPITVILTIPTLRNMYIGTPFGGHLGMCQKRCFSPKD